MPEFKVVSDFRPTGDQPEAMRLGESSYRPSI